MFTGMKTPGILVVALCLAGPVLAQAQTLDPASLSTALAGKPAGAEAEQLAARIRTWFGGSDNLIKGPAPKIDDLTVAWAIEAPGLPANAVPRVVSDVVAFTMPLARVGDTPVYAGVARLAHGYAMSWHYELPDRRLGGSQLEVYETHPDSLPQAGVPKGVVKQMPPWESRIFAGTKRDWWIYVPAQYDAASPAAVMVFQDGAGPKDYVPTVFDNLIAKRDMPVTVGVFIQPGVHADGRANRSFEYDTLSDQYARFLLEEILPEVEKTV